MAKMKGRLIDRHRLAKKYSYVRAPKRNVFIGDKDLQMEIIQVSFNNESSKSVTFEFPFTSSNYTVALTPRQTVLEAVDSAAVNLYVQSPTITGFTIGATAPFTGIVDVMVVKIS